jgi:UDP-GlcNAc:undecaprenyl-phosphate/decaprenyl-phosphate GlcNAc-1-phosphate transferase
VSLPPRRRIIADPIAVLLPVMVSAIIGPVLWNGRFANQPLVSELVLVWDLAMSKVENLLVCALAGFAVSFGVISAILRIRRRRQTSRSVDFHHASGSDNVAVPRYGGLGLAAAFLALLFLLSLLFGSQFGAAQWTIGGTALAMFALGFCDDLRALGAKKKLFGQLLIASAAYFWGLDIHEFKIPLADRIIDLGLFSWPITVLWLVAMTNLINLIDGVDGLAGGITLMLMLLLSVIGGGTELVPLLAAGMAGALIGFLRYNFPPAKIYLGDGGAYFLGFLIGGLTIHSSQKGTVVAALIAPLFVLALPIMDTSLAILRRGLNGLPLFRADRRHLHHRLLQSGLSRRHLTLGAYAFTAYFLGLALVAFLWRGQYLALVLGGAMLSVLLLAGHFRFSRQWFNVRKVLGNALSARSEIRYALAQSRWLAMEGARGRDIQSICDDVVTIARRLGFVGVRVQLENGAAVWRLPNSPAPDQCERWEYEKGAVWKLTTGGGCCCFIFRHYLPAHPGCFVELQTPDIADAKDISGSPAPSKARLTCPSKFEIVSEVLAEGWAKSMRDWQRLNQLPIQFDQLNTSIVPMAVFAADRKEARAC